MTESINHTEVTCVADFLNVLKNDVEELDSNRERFFRGLSKTDYIATYFPSIYRSPDNNSEYEPYIKYEHKMFYDLVSRFPEQFSSCKNTFEHLVMMQHYGFPTRLLDVTSNPLIALYFSCVDRHGNVNSSENGAVTIYDIPDKQIKNYNSDTVTILSNLSRISNEYQAYYSYFNYFLQSIKMLGDDNNVKHYAISFIETIIKKIPKIIALKSSAKINSGLISEKEEYLEENSKKILTKISEYNTLENSADKKKKLIQIKDSVVSFSKWILIGNNVYPHLIDLKFKHLIQEEKNYFIYENTQPINLTSFFCVKPKLNNPRLNNQSGAFLLFGFADKNSKKDISPKQHLKIRMKITKELSGIIIKKENKIKIYEELKQLGIHRAFLFPEIDNVSQIVVSNYKNLKDDSTQTN